MADPPSKTPSAPTLPQLPLLPGETPRGTGNFTKRGARIPRDRVSSSLHLNLPALQTESKDRVNSPPGPTECWLFASPHAAAPLLHHFTPSYPKLFNSKAVKHLTSHLFHCSWRFFPTRFQPHFPAPLVGSDCEGVLHSQSFQT